MDTTTEGISPMGLDQNLSTNSGLHRRAGARRGRGEDPDWAHIERLLDRLDARVGEPGGVPGEIVLRPGRAPLADAA
ncbi:MAG: hypothetical protein ACR2N6_00545 [Miltoncostaeaceae bacterium]